MLLFVTGPSNGGKSTIGRLLAKHFSVPLVEADTIRHMFLERELRRANNYHRELTTELIASVTDTYDKFGFSAVVTDGIGSTEEFTRVVGRLKQTHSVHLMGLTCSFESIVGERNKYKDDPYMLGRLKGNFEAFESAVVEGIVDFVIDTDGRSVDETFQDALEIAQAVGFESSKRQA